MNSFEIVRAKRALVEEIRRREDGRLSIEGSREFLQGAGFRVNHDVLKVLVLGSSDSPLRFDGDDIVLNSPQ